MKTNMAKVVMGMVALTVMLTLGTGSVVNAGIAGSKHDFSSTGWSGGEICIVCHTPHNADTSVAGTPLWNHAVTASSYTVYSSSTLNAVVGQPSGVSKLCLSCHDGTVALDSFGGATGTHMITGTANLGTNLSNDHPISFTYDTALATADGGLFDPAVKTSGIGGTVSHDLLFSGKLECASCHDVHNGLGIANLLRKANTGSALCLTCHNK
jgi:predicted CXXCH cytochrome family protein